MERASLSIKPSALAEGVQVVPNAVTALREAWSGASDPSSLRENRRAARYLGNGVVEKRQ